MKREIRAYQETYLNRAQTVLGDVFHSAVNVCGIPGDDFVKLFVGSSISSRFEKGEPEYLAGKSGIEIAVEIIEETTDKQIHVEPQNTMDCSKEYWIGWAVVYYQWYSDRKYSHIFQAVRFEDLQELYEAYHQTDISRFVTFMNQRMKEAFSETNLKRIRSIYGCTQEELAKRSGVSLRSIQMYEQRNKEINKASVETVHRIAKVLGCTIEDLTESYA